MTHETYIQGLREVAQFYEDNPTTPLPYEGNLCCFSIFGAPLAAIAAGAKAFGESEKIYTEQNFELRKTFPSGVVLRFWTDRKSVCERVVVGTKVLPQVEVPAVPAKEAYIIPPQTVEDVKWRCKPILSEA